DGPKRIAKKLGEEAVELALEAENGTKDRFLDEASDLMYHLIVLLTAKEFSLTDVAERLKERHTHSKASKAEVDDFQRGEKQWGK
ncbi:MAG TPA: phosphoribosyl-ATP diphosphatase, partial [Tenuifilaceae bacterium]|nr:phosphoribosyl-ATP diphosphatase [Tenuifilaceae bacterium]